MSLAAFVKRGLAAARRPRHTAAAVRRRAGGVQNRVFGQPVMVADWDNLVLLGGCRYDVFAERHDLPGRLETRRSRGSTTTEFLRNNFAGRRFPDTVCVTADPFASELTADAVCHCVHTWRRHWDDDLGTVPPGPMTRAVRSVADRFPRKRLVAHFVQPRHPFVGTVAGDTSTGAGAVVDGHPGDLWTALAAGEVSVAAARRAYEQTLDAVLPHVAELVTELPGRTVVTSDHGVLLGESTHDHLAMNDDRHGHFANGTARPLVEVPWLVVDDGSRKPIVAGTIPEIEAERETEAGPAGRANATGRVVDRLRSLGER